MLSFLFRINQSAQVPVKKAKMRRTSQGTDENIPFSLMLQQQIIMNYLNNLRFFQSRKELAVFL